MLSAFFVHTHNYPGRMTIHLVPFAAALAVIAATRPSRPLQWRRAAARRAGASRMSAAATRLSRLSRASACCLRRSPSR